MNDADRIRTYLQGWDDGERFLIRTLLDVPEEHRSGVVEHRAKRILDQSEDGGD